MTNQSEVTTVIDGRAFLECPRWRDGRLWVSDLYVREVLSLGDDNGDDVRVEATLDDQPSGLGWLPDGRLLIVSMIDGKVLVREDADDPTSLRVHADVSELATGKLNDMTVDATGHAFISTFGFEFRSRSYVESAVLIHVAPDGTAEVAANDLLFPNGSVIFGEPDDAVRTFVVTPGTTWVPTPSSVKISSSTECGSRPSTTVARFTPPRTAFRHAVIFGIMPLASEGNSSSRDSGLISPITSVLFGQSAYSPSTSVSTSNFSASNAIASAAAAVSALTLYT